MNRRLDRSARRYAAWMLLAIFVWVMQPLATSLFCHEDASHDHSAHASTHSTGDARGHDEARADAHKEASSAAHHNTASQRPEPTPESCCSHSQETLVTVAATASYSGSSAKDAPASQPVAILPLTYQAEVALTVSSRAGPDIPSLYCQLSRSSFSNRAPPISA